ncbi:MAG: cysteine desulfurase [Phycisphaerales bacterium]|nr:cysteine desulfurase [Phycisphaerales bacterium]
MPVTDPTRPDAPPATLDVARVRAEFPILAETINGRPLAYLDNAATGQKPRATIDAVRRYYETTNANVHRGVHSLSVAATDAYEGARDRVRRFLGAADIREIIFTRGTTESINLVAQAYGRPRLGPGDEILITHLEHHSNIVPWQLLCEQTGATLRVLPIDDRGALVVDRLDDLLTERTRIVAVGHVSNALGTVNPIDAIIERARAAGAVTVIDGAQAAPHGPVDVQELGCDFYALSAHKMFGPTGVGVLYGRRDLLEAMPPYQGGGEMIKSVTFDGTVYNALPHKFEAGTPNIAGVVGLGATIEYLESLGWDAIEAHERHLLDDATEKLGTLPGVRLIGTAPEKIAVVSFVVEGIHPHDVGTILDHEGVAIRTGHHCAQPVMDFFDVPATARASFALYNTTDEIDALVQGLQRVMEVFG